MTSAPVLSKRQPPVRANDSLRPSLSNEMLVLVMNTWHRKLVTGIYGVPLETQETASGLPPSATFLLEREAKKLESFLALPDDWDSYGAPPVQPAAVQRAVELLQDPTFVQLLSIVNPRVAVFPLRNGGVQLDLNGGKKPLEIEISDSGDTEFAFFSPSNEIVWEGHTLKEAVTQYLAF